jgi:NAD(P)H dehydrogenase (quinone)
MSIVVTGATGQLGRLVVAELLERGVPASEVVATGRATDQIKDLADRGVRVEAVDYGQPETLRPALAGARKVLLISGSEFGARVSHHANVIAAAEASGADLLVYTSVLNADRARFRIAEDHRATEQALAASGVAVTVLRNGWYLENYTPQIPAYLEHGAVLGSAGDGRVSAATRADFAAAAAAVLASDGHEGRTYELAADAFTMSGLAAAVGKAAGRQVVYRDLPEQEYAEVLTGAGLPAQYAEILADGDRGIARGELFTESDDLARLIGRPATTMPEAVAAAA